MWRYQKKTESLRDGKVLQLPCEFCQKVTFFREYRSTAFSTSYFLPMEHEEKYFMVCTQCENRYEYESNKSSTSFSTLYKHAKEKWEKIKGFATAQPLPSAGAKDSPPEEGRLKKTLEAAKSHIEDRLGKLKGKI